MPKDSEWKKQGDGSWTRKTGDVEETTFVNPNATAGAVDAASELGVDINSVTGTGKDGAVTKADVDAAAKEG